MGNTLVRHHHVPTKDLFTPDDMDYMPVDMSVVSCERVTHMNCGQDSLKVVHRDSWQGNETDGRALRVRLFSSRVVSGS